MEGKMYNGQPTHYTPANEVIWGMQVPPFLSVRLSV